MLRRPVPAKRLPGLLLPILLLVAGCTSEALPPGSPSPLRDERLHALMVGELDQELARLDVLAFDLHLTQTELDVVRQRRATAIAFNAAQLRDSAASVLALQTTLALTADAASRFAALARQLQEKAAALELLASSGKLQEISPLMRDLRATCNSCHSLYRQQ